MVRSNTKSANDGEDVVSALRKQIDTMQDTIDGMEETQKLEREATEMGEKISYHMDECSKAETPEEREKNPSCKKLVGVKALFDID